MTEIEAADRLGDDLVSIKLFGSAARGEKDPDSDVDLVLTLANGVDLHELEEIITEVDLDVGQRLGCPVNSISVTEREYAKKVKGKGGFWKDIPKESKIIYERARQEKRRVTKKIPTRNVSKSAAVNYLGKARQFSRAMIESLGKGDWDAAGLRCGSLCDLR